MGKDDKKNMEGAAETRNIEKEVKEKIVQEAMSKAMIEERSKGRRLQQIVEEIHKLGMTEGEYWQKVLKEDLKKGRDEWRAEGRDYLRELEESGKTPEEKFWA